jgi:hypothetical protein
MAAVTAAIALTWPHGQSLIERMEGSRSDGLTILAWMLAFSFSWMLFWAALARSRGWSAQSSYALSGLLFFLPLGMYTLVTSSRMQSFTLIVNLSVAIAFGAGRLTAGRGFWRKH